MSMRHMESLVEKPIIRRIRSSVVDMAPVSDLRVEAGDHIITATIWDEPYEGASSYGTRNVQLVSESDDRKESTDILLAWGSTKRDSPITEIHRVVESGYESYEAHWGGDLNYPRLSLSGLYVVYRNLQSLQTQEPTFDSLTATELAMSDI